MVELSMWFKNRKLNIQGKQCKKNQGGILDVC